MKGLKIFLSLIVIVLVSAYTLLFTSFGNSLLKPIIQTKIQQATNLDIELQKFSLSFSSLDIIAAITPSNTIHLQGAYSLFSQAVDINYNVDFLQLKELKKLAKRPLDGVFHTQGKIKGDLTLLNVDGKSDVAKSTTTYHITLKDTTPTNIQATIKELDLKTLLTMIGEQPYAQATLNTDIVLNDIRKRSLDGTISLQTSNGVFNQKVFQKAFNIELPKTTFSMDLQAKLNKESINYNYIFNSNLAKINTKGDVVVEPLKVDINYDAHIKELALLKPITKADLRGAINLQGTLKGDKESMKFHLLSDLAASKTVVDASLKEFQLKDLRASIDHLKIQKLLYMLHQPRYANGEFNLKADLSSLKKDNLAGKVLTTSTIIPNSKYLTKTYKFKHPMPQTTMKLKTSSKLHKTFIDTLAILRSDLFNLDTKQARFNLKDSSLKSDFLLAIAKLDRLYFITDKHLRGSFTAKGNIKKDKDLLLISHSKIAQGDLNIKLLNDKLHLKLDDMRTKKLLWMLYYPEIFDGGINANVDYNLALQKGDIVAKFDKGVFVHNQPFDLLKQFAHIDLYKEYFDGDATAKINKENIFATFDLKSRKASITSKKTYLNTKSSTIDSAITIKTKKMPVTVTLKGDITQPKVGVDMQKLLSSQAGQKLEKKAKKGLDKLFKKLF